MHLDICNRSFIDWLNYVNLVDFHISLMCNRIIFASLEFRNLNGHKTKAKDLVIRKTLYK